MRKYNNNLYIYIYKFNYNDYRLNQTKCNLNGKLIWKKKNNTSMQGLVWWGDVGQLWGCQVVWTESLKWTEWVASSEAAGAQLPGLLLISFKPEREKEREPERFAALGKGEEEGQREGEKVGRYVRKNPWKAQLKRGRRLEVRCEFNREHGLKTHTFCLGYIWTGKNVYLD